MIFFPQHFLGLQGMPRRYPGYNEAYTLWHWWSSVGYMISMAATLVFFLGILEAILRQRKGVANPWGEGANTLEWTLSSPPPFHQYSTLPEVPEDDHH